MCKQGNPKDWKQYNIQGKRLVAYMCKIGQSKDWKQSNIQGKGVVAYMCKQGSWTVESYRTYRVMKQSIEYRDMKCAQFFLSGNLSNFALKKKNTNAHMSEILESSENCPKYDVTIIPVVGVIGLKLYVNILPKNMVKFQI